jgi:nickel superoxide dismutase
MLVRSSRTAFDLHTGTRTRKRTPNMRPTIYVTAAALGIAFAAFLAFPQPSARGHCEVPCGIYTDHARIVQMLEDTTTVGKATEEILALEGKSDVQSVNQMVRWVTNKEEHATRIQHTIAQYFLTQRVKPKPMGSDEWDDYVTRLTAHHAVMVAAMKTKQTVDRANVAALRAAIEGIAGYYPAPRRADDRPG